MRALPAAPVEMLASPVPAEGESRAQTRDPSNPIEVSPPPSHPEDAPLICPSPPLQDAETPANFSPPASAQTGPSGPEGSLPQQPPVQFQASHQITKALFAPKQQIQPPVSQVQVQVQVQVQLARSSSTSPAPLQVSVSVPQQQPRPTKQGDDSAAQQHKHQSEFPAAAASPSFIVSFIVSFLIPPEPTAALETKSRAFTPEVFPASPAAQGTQAHLAPGPVQTTQKAGTKVRPAS